MTWVAWVVGGAALVLAGIWFLQRFFAKATLNSALVRTGLGGRRVVLNGGCVSLPILHQLQRVNMGAVAIKVVRAGREALLTEDQLRADIEMEFEFRVLPTEEGVAAAAQSFGRKIERSGDTIADVICGPLIAAMQNAAAGQSLAGLHGARTALTEAIRAAVTPQVEQFGLALISASLLRIDQSDLSQFDERNTFDARGMRRHAELVSEQRRERVRIESETEIAVRESGLAKHRRQLEIERTERAASIANQKEMDRLEAEARAETEQAKSAARLEAERSRITAERQIKAAQVANDEELRRAEMAAILALEERKIEQEAHLARLRTAEFETQAAEEAARAQVVLAAEDVQAKKEQAVAQREHATAHLQLRKEIELGDLKARNEAETLAIRTGAEAESKRILAAAELTRAEAEARGRAAMIAADNAMNPGLVAMRLEERRLDRMPEIMTQMMKPVEKIDSIRICQVGGPGTHPPAAGEGHAEGAFGAALEQILSMAVRLPAMKQMGEDIGIGFDAALAGRTADYANRLKAKKKGAPGSAAAAGSPPVEDHHDH